MELLLETWWSGMQVAEKVYWLIAIPFTLIFLIMMVLTLIGGDVDSADMDVDMEMDTDTGIGFQYLSLKNLVGFFTIFGWTGVACLASGKGMVFTVIVSVLAGLLMMTIMSTITYRAGQPEPEKCCRENCDHLSHYTSREKRNG
jgi:hypothetical protein